MRSVLVTLAAVAAPVIVSAAVVPLRGDISQATAALGLAVVVSLVAAIGTRVTAAVAAVSAALCFDFFFTRPYGSFSISSTQDIERTRYCWSERLSSGSCRREIASTEDALRRPARISAAFRPSPS
jgi:K+-sensing histidine kinase KdpD